MMGATQLSRVLAPGGKVVRTGLAVSIGLTVLATTPSIDHTKP